MQNTSGNKVRLGIFVTAAVALLIAGVYFIGQRQQLFNSTFHISGVFKGVAGLQTGNNVRFSGINIGVVESMEQITDSTVRVNMQLDQNVRKFIKRDAKAVISSDGLLGNKIISIVPGANGTVEIANNDVIQTVQPVNMDDVMVRVKVISTNVADMSEDLAAIMKSIHEGKGTIGRLLMDSVLAENVYQAMVNIKQGAGGFKQNMDAAGHSFLLRGYLKKKQKEDDKKKAAAAGK
jgi:phospholipid/cholesterol/gamma-HCH transport system substrate-binding protein